MCRLTVGTVFGTTEDELVLGRRKTEEKWGTCLIKYKR
jgi:hypothetical protein